MKITDLRVTDPVYMTARMGADATVDARTISALAFVEICTDEGVMSKMPAGGLQAGPYGEELNKVLIENVLKPYVVGQDPLDTERIWDRMYWGSIRYGRRGAVLSAIGSIDVALWDLKGKILNQSVHKLLGGHRDTVPVYGSSINLDYTREELVETFTDFVASGFKMVKMKVGRRDPIDDLERVKLVRETIGANVDLALDVNSGWSLATAMRMVKKLETYNIYWLEEPLPPDQIENHATLASKTNIPIALGETHATKWEYRDLIERGSVKIIQSDIIRCGGVTEWAKIAAMVSAYGLPMCPHATGNIAPSLVAAVPNGLFVEWIQTHNQATERESIFKDPVKPVNGEISPVNTPGFGIEIDEEVLEKLKANPKPSIDEFVLGTKRGWQWPPYL